MTKYISVSKNKTMTFKVMQAKSYFATDSNCNHRTF